MVKNNEWAMISASEITESVLLKRGMTSHEWWRLLPIVCEGIQELAFTSIPLVRHTQITKASGQTWFELPAGFQDWVSVGIRIGNKWVPVGVSERLMPYPNSECAGGQYDNEFNAGKYKVNGSWKSWLNSNCTFKTDDFLSDDFLNSDFSDGDTSVQQPQSFDPYAFGGWGYGYLFPYSNYGFNTSDIGEPVQGRFSQFIRPDEVTFNVQKGIIMVPDAFPSNILYLSYIGLGTADSLTYIPINGQAVIEAYAEWKYAQNTPRKSGSLSESRYFKSMFDEQHRLYRARNNNLTETVIRRIVDRGYIQNAWGNGDGCVGGSSNNPTTVIYYTNQSITVTSGVGGVTYVQSPLITGKNVVYVIVGSVYKTSGYYVQGDMLIFNDGTDFYVPTTVVIYYAN